MGEAYVRREARPRWEGGDRFTSAVTLLKYRHFAAAQPRRNFRNRELYG